MSWWEQRVVPLLVDLSLSQAPVMERRVRVCAGLSGRVLEIGFGSGLNLTCLPAEVTALDAVEPSERAWSRSAERRRETPVEVTRIGLDGQAVTAADASYDAALVTFSLCTIPDAGRALAELHRVLRPGGALHFLEHGRAPDAGVRRWQHRLDPLQGAVFGGCHLTRDPVALVEEAGFAVAEVEAGYDAPGPARPWGYLTRGVASRVP
jgi:ubiquinone/menaquinone biosynthesis C-methylase UbiE